MALSRLRIRLAGVFALTLAAALVLVATASLGWLWRESTLRLNTRVTRIAALVEEAIVREQAESPDSSLSFALDEVRRDWVWSGDQWIVLDTSGNLISTVANAATVTRINRAWRAAPPSEAGQRFDSDVEGDDLHGVVRQVPRRGRAPAYTVLAFASSEGIERDTEGLAVALAIAAPMIVLVSMAGGYLLARRALQPVQALGTALEQIGATDLSARVPVNAVPDEVDQLAIRFNDLLARVESAQEQNRRFVREAAHQVRTPLTLVRGEADLALATDTRSASELAAALSRIRSASEQMQRRVDELMLLAEAEAGVRIDLRELVELDGLTLEAVDLFRARATQLGRSLALGEVHEVRVRGNSALLREAVLELLENACRHGAAQTQVTVSVRHDDERAIISVESASDVAESSARPGRGVGQRIVQWIAEGHGGAFSVQRSRSSESEAIVAECYLACIELPLGATGR